MAGSADPSPAYSLSVLVGQEDEGRKEKGRSHMAREPIPVTSAMSSLWINAGWLLESEPSRHPSVHLYISHANGPFYLGFSGCTFCRSEKSDTIVKIGKDNVFCEEKLLSKACSLNVTMFQKGWMGSF